MDADEKEPERKSGKRLKKNAVLILLSAVAVLAILFLLLLFLPKEEVEPEEIQYYFYPVSEKNIFEDETFLSLDRAIYYQPDPAGYGVREEILKEEVETLDPRVRLLVNLLETVTAGNSGAYPSFFTDSYRKKTAFTQFTQQMLYELEIRFVSETSEGSTYRLDYKIRRNNGTYRRDVGSDMCRSQYVVLTRQSDGSYLIDDLYYRTFVKK